MPTPIKVRECVVDAAFYVTLSCEFEADLLDIPEEETRLPIQSDMPLKGEWYISITRKDADTVKLIVWHGVLPFGQLGSRTCIDMRLDWLDATTSDLIRATSSGFLPVPDNNEQGTPYRGWQLKTAQAIPPFADCTKARSIARLGVAPPIHLRLSFPKSADSELDLWTTTSFLAEVSDYYKDLLASGCAETQPRRSKRRRNGKAPSNADASDQAQPDANSEQSTVDWQDSDDEADDFIISRKAFANKDTLDKLGDSEFRQIETRETAFSTFRAVLLYLQMQTGEIRFAPLKSSLAPHKPGAKTTRTQLLSVAFVKEPDLPLPVSPKSVFRLAHLIRHEKLQKVALEAFASRLTIDGAAHELFCPVAVAYDEVRKPIVDYVVKNWKEIKATTSWKLLRPKAACGEIGGGAQILSDLLGAMCDD
ncbi:hypothetical protein JCM10908_003350 [Rhodotorula pacifica]|uniref:uncharacterized protein n=1 Tax=Rhodotorula pacifica TaxID=1495444 RepID=UPI003174A442